MAALWNLAVEGCTQTKMKVQQILSTYYYGDIAEMVAKHGVVT